MYYNCITPFHIPQSIIFKYTQTSNYTNLQFQIRITLIRVVKQNTQLLQNTFLQFHTTQFAKSSFKYSSNSYIQIHMTSSSNQHLNLEKKHNPTFGIAKNQPIKCATTHANQTIYYFQNNLTLNSASNVSSHIKQHQIFQSCLVHEHATTQLSKLSLIITQIIPSEP